MKELLQNVFGPGLNFMELFEGQLLGQVEDWIKKVKMYFIKTNEHKMINGGISEVLSHKIISNPLI